MSEVDGWADGRGEREKRIRGREGGGCGDSLSLMRWEENVGTRGLCFKKEKRRDAERKRGKKYALPRRTKCVLARYADEPPVVSGPQNLI